ncbi:hypothetical protein RvY_00189 [Ramazzottius varieornatus]|uniref:Uncharacterized protein n=1 Tax=Ramazzottius varieornatus TaxID=947166 RepID=A0A1D1UI75_RAMVA|nr:hypothetical protein RvY_00189 [Ramazzottius varieornatus]
MDEPNVNKVDWIDVEYFDFNDERTMFDWSNFDIGQPFADLNNDDDNRRQCCIQ